MEALKNHYTKAHPPKPPEQGNQSKSYAEAVKSNDKIDNPLNDSGALEEIQHDQIPHGNSLGGVSLENIQIEEGIPAIKFSMKEVESLSQSCKMLMVGKFSHGRPHLDKIRRVFQSLSLRSGFMISVLDQKHILINLFSEEDVYRMWIRGTWLIENFPMRIFKWDHRFNVEKESSMAPVWISIPNLPIHFFEKDALFSIAQVMGRPIRVDTATLGKTRPSCAHVCVEMDLAKHHPNRVKIHNGDFGFWQTISIENIPLYRNLCSKKGHSI